MFLAYISLRLSSIHYPYVLYITNDRAERFCLLYFCKKFKIWKYNSRYKIDVKLTIYIAMKYLIEQQLVDKPIKLRAVWFCMTGEEVSRRNIRSCVYGWPKVDLFLRKWVKVKWDVYYNYGFWTLKTQVMLLSLQSNCFTKL